MHHSGVFFIHLAIPFSWHNLVESGNLVSFGRAWGMWRELFYILNQVLFSVPIYSAESS